MITYKTFLDLLKSSYKEDKEELEAFRKKYPSMYEYYEGIYKVGA